MQCFQYKPKMGRPGESPPRMSRRRAVSILRRWSSYDSETIAAAEQVIRTTGRPCVSSLSHGAIYGGAIMLAALVGLLGIAQFLGAGM